MQINSLALRYLLTDVSRHPATSIICAVLFGIGLFHIVLAVVTVSTYGLNYPFMDEIRISQHYIEIPFPRNILQLENGHRIVLPGLLRYIEINLMHGFPRLQLIASTAAIFASFGILASAVIREPQQAVILKIGMLTLIASLLFWVAHARMLIHIFESCHILFITFFLVLAVRCVVRAPVTRTSLWIFAVLCCAGATFSFGPGIASFAALFSVALARRAPVKVLCVIVLMASLCLILYTYWLPGAEGARQNIGGRWSTSIFILIARVGAMWVAIFDPYSTGNAMRILNSCVFGLVGLVIPSMSMGVRLLKKQAFTEVGLYGIAFFAFGLTANMLITISRHEYFAQYPDQLFADRYLFWSSLTWLGISLYSFSLLKGGSSAAKIMFLAGAFLISASAIRPAFISTAWSATVYRNVELSAIATYMNIHDDEIIGGVSDGPPESTYRAARVMQEKQLGAFWALSGIQIGAKPIFAEQNSSSPIPAISMTRGHEWSTQGGDRFLVVNGGLPYTLAKTIGRKPIVVANKDGAIIGIVTLNSTGKSPRSILLRNGTTFTEFSGYIQSTSTPARLGTLQSDGSFYSVAETLQ